MRRVRAERGTGMLADRARVHGVPGAGRDHAAPRVPLRFATAAAGDGMTAPALALAPPAPPRAVASGSPLTATLAAPATRRPLETRIIHERSAAGGPIDARSNAGRPASPAMAAPPPHVVERELLAEQVYGLIVRRLMRERARKGI
jgi:hypothetical protein